MKLISIILLLLPCLAFAQNGDTTNPVCYKHPPWQVQDSIILRTKLEGCYWNISAKDWHNLKKGDSLFFRECTTKEQGVYEFKKNGKIKTWNTIIRTAWVPFGTWLLNHNGMEVTINDTAGYIDKIKKLRTVSIASDKITFTIE